VYEKIDTRNAFDESNAWVHEFVKLNIETKHEDGDKETDQKIDKKTEKKKRQT